MEAGLTDHVWSLEELVGLLKNGGRRRRREASPLCTDRCGSPLAKRDLWLGISSAIARKIRPIGAIAETLDRLPPAVAASMFILLWFAFLLGWIVLLIFGTRPLFESGSNV
jgi:hypothetical protein